MADNTIPITAGTGTNVRTVTNAGIDGGAHQQIVGLADAAGNLLGTVGAPLPVSQATSIPAGSNVIGIAALPPSTLVVTTSAAAAAGTATLPAAGAGLFHYITNVTIQRTTTAATTGAASNFVTGGTNQGLIFQLPSDTQAIGFSQTVINYTPGTPLRSTAANTATTVTTPVVTATTYRITVTYYTAA